LNQLILLPKWCNVGLALICHFFLSWTLACILVLQIMSFLLFELF
jgi:hypothetical protein